MYQTKIRTENNVILFPITVYFLSRFFCLYFVYFFGGKVVLHCSLFLFLSDTSLFFFFYKFIFTTGFLILPKRLRVRSGDDVISGAFPVCASPGTGKFAVSGAGARDGTGSV